MEYDQSNLCRRCEIENTKRDSYFCEGCEKYATVSRLVNLAPDDDGEVVNSGQLIIGTSAMIHIPSSCFNDEPAPF